MKRMPMAVFIRHRPLRATAVELIPVQNLNQLENELGSPRVLVCPGDSAHTPFPKGKSWSGLGPENISYQFLLPGAEEEKTPLKAIKLICPVHDNQVLMDGSVHVKEPELRRAR